MTTAELKSLENSVATIHLKDGEILKATVLFVGLEYEDIIVDVLETNQPEHYKDSNSAYTIPTGEIVSAQLSN